MWPKSYRDYRKDAPLKKNIVDPQNGIIGCEMHDLNGWGNELHILPKKEGLARTLLAAIFGKF